jgi:hypothetical protein
MYDPPCEEQVEVLTQMPWFLYAPVAVPEQRPLRAPRAVGNEARTRHKMDRIVNHLQMRNDGWNLTRTRLEGQRHHLISYFKDTENLLFA